MKNELEINNSLFESIKHFDEDGNEYWSARELMPALEYIKWQKFNEVINRAKKACEKSNVKVDEHFTGAGKVLRVGNNAKMSIKDYHLTRYACYLIAQNADSRKKVVALAQTYFAVQTRKMELIEDRFKSLTEDEERLIRRKEVKSENLSLNRTAVKAGVKHLDQFHNAGYKGLYNGETANDIARRKGLRYREEILDNMGSDELIVNLFRISQTNLKLKKDNVKGETNANSIHFEVGKRIRKTIEDIDGVMPEDMPKPIKSIKEIEKENKIIKR